MKSPSCHPIGLFDSGVGGTSVWKEVHRELPRESTIYLADSRNAPYGEKSHDEIVSLSIKNTEWLLQRDCKLIVVACNTATTHAIDILRQSYKVPFVGIEPAIKPAALQSKTGVVGILATRGTLSSSLFASTSGKYASHVKRIEVMGDGLVPLIETGRIYSDEMTALLEKYLVPMAEAGIDHLVLGCTHYPYLVPRIREFLPESVTIIDSGRAVARQTRAVLEARQLLCEEEVQPSYDFYTNSDPVLLRSFLEDVKNDYRVLRAGIG